MHNAEGCCNHLFENKWLNLPPIGYKALRAGRTSNIERPTSNKVFYRITKKASVHPSDTPLFLPLSAQKNPRRRTIAVFYFERQAEDFIFSWMESVASYSFNSDPLFPQRHKTVARRFNIVVDRLAFHFEKEKDGRSHVPGIEGLKIGHAF